MHRMHSVLLLAAILLVPLALSGCGRKADLNKARSVVETALSSWKQGQEPQALLAQGIEMTDPDWQAGHRLMDFTVKNASTQPQQGPRVVVVLATEDRAGNKATTEVAYEVLMSNNIRIGRDAFHIAQ